jgi:hypothetical protein
MLMFNPSKEEVRQFFCETWRKTHAQEILTPLEAIARDWMLLHPEYDAVLADPESALQASYGVEQGQSNPFLHLAMHLSISEQIAIDQPAGIQPAFTRLAQRLDSEHEAQHQIMECLGEMLWTSQRNATPPDGMAYVECILRRAQA